MKYGDLSCGRLCRKNLDEIARAFNVVVNQTSIQSQNDSRLKKSYQNIYSSLTMSYTKT